MLKCPNFSACKGSILLKNYLKIDISQLDEKAPKTFQKKVIYLQKLAKDGEIDSVICQTGYKGILCQQWIENYFKIGLYICGKC